MADPVPNPLTTPGTYFAAVVHYPMEAGIIGVYGPWLGRKHAENEAARLREAGIHPNDEWAVVPLRRIDLGPANV